MFMMTLRNSLLLLLLRMLMLIPFSLSLVDISNDARRCTPHSPSSSPFSSGCFGQRFQLVRIALSCPGAREGLSTRHCE